MRAVCHLAQEVIGIRRQPADGVTMSVSGRAASSRSGITSRVTTIPTLRRSSDDGVQILRVVRCAQR